MECAGLIVFLAPSLSSPLNIYFTNGIFIMRKTDKKLEKQLISSLTEVCETSLKAFNGFQWLTHQVNYSNFPKSLNIICVFDTNEHLNDFYKKDSTRELSALIQSKLFEVDITLKNAASHITYDTEENCQRSHGGKWVNRLNG